MKKLVSIVLALALVLAVAVAFAEGTNTITIDKNYDKQVYTLYKLFDATVNGARSSAIDTGNESSVYTAGIAYTLIDETDHALTKEFTVTKNDGTTATVKAGDWFEYVNDTNHNIKAKDSADVTTELFRLWAKAYGVQVGSALTANGNNDTSIKWTGLDDGYYFISTTTGSLVTVDSVAPNAIVKDKNEVPGIDKVVSGGTEVGSTTAVADKDEANTASIGDILTYTSTIHAKPHGTKYVFVDTMETGLSLQNYADGVKCLVQVNNTDLVLDTDYTIDTFTTGKGGTFTITFAQTYLDSITENTDIVITYKVLVNEDAEIETANVNTSKLSFGDKGTTFEDSTNTFVYKFQLVKDDNRNTILTGAEFKLYGSETGTDEIPVVKTADGKYRVALSTETGVAIEAGTPEISGLENGEYWVEETKAPDGYNKLQGRAKITLKDESNMATILSGRYESGGLEVENLEGTVLPSTGGIGTTIFYILGGLLVVGAAVILVARRKASN